MLLLLSNARHILFSSAPRLLFNHIMARLRALDLAKPFQALLPEIRKPYYQLELYDRIVYAVCSGVLYCMLSELPLYGVTHTLETPDCQGWLRYVLGSSNGTPIEIGLAPVILSGTTFQILAGLRYLNVNLETRSDRALFQSAQKLVAIALTIALSILVVLSGTYSPVSTLGVSVTVGLIAQLILGGLSLIYIDEVLTKGYGIGTGLLLFTVIRGAQRFTWSLAGFENITTLRGTEFYGALPNLFHLFTNRDIRFAAVDAAFRPLLPNVSSLLVALLTYFAFIYLTSVRLNVPIQAVRMRSQQSTFPIRLLYSNAQPLLYVCSLLSILFTVSSSLDLISSNPFIHYLGQWRVIAETKIPTGGLVYWLSTPSCLLRSPLRALTSTIFTTVVCAFVSRAWAESSGSNATDLAKQFKEQGVVLQGRRDTSLHKELKKIIQPAAFLGGVITGLAACFFNMLGGDGWGFVMGTSVLNMLNVFEILTQENVTPDTLSQMKQSVY